MQKRFFILLLSFIFVFSFNAFAGEEEVKEVEGLIENIVDEESAEKARAAYDALSAADKLQVSNLEELEAAESDNAEDQAIADIVNAGSDSECETAEAQTSEQSLSDIIASNSQETESESEAEEEQSSSSSLADIIAGNSETDNADGQNAETPASGDAEDVYFYTVDFSEISAVWLYTDDVIDNTQITLSCEDTTIIVTDADSNAAIGEYTVSLLWDTYSLKLTASSGSILIETSSPVSYTTTKTMSQAEETQVAEEDGGSFLGTYGGLLIFILVLVFFLFFYRFSKRKKTGLKRKELPKKSAAEEIADIKKQLNRMDFSDRNAGAFIEEEKKEEKSNVAVENAFEELEEGTQNLHGQKYEEEKENYLRKLREEQE